MNVLIFMKTNRRRFVKANLLGSLAKRALSALDGAVRSVSNGPQ
jgi:hypothetical protein